MTSPQEQNLAPYDLLNIVTLLYGNSVRLPIRLHRCLRKFNCFQLHFLNFLLIILFVVVIVSGF